MKKFLIGPLLSLAIIPFAFAQDHFKGELARLIQNTYRPGTSQLTAASDNALYLSSELLKQEETKSRILSIPGRGQSYKALEIISTSESREIGTRIHKWQKELNDLSFIYVPEVLLPGNTSAFFSPNGKSLGIAHDLLLSPDRLSSPTIHETYHAYTYKQVIDSQEDLFAGYYEVKSGTYISTANTEYYFRYGSIDEIQATALSVLIDFLKMVEEKDLNQSQRENLLNEIYHSLLVLKSLSAQLIEVTTRLRSSSDYTVQNIPLSLGNKSRVISQLTYELDSYSRETVAGGGGTFFAPHKKGAKWHMYLAGNSTRSEIEARLTRLSAAGQIVSELSKKSISCIYVMIQYPRLDRTDMNCLAKYSPQIYNQSEALKRLYYPLIKFVR